MAKVKSLSTSIFSSIF